MFHGALLLLGEVAVKDVVNCVRVATQLLVIEQIVELYPDSVT